MFQGSSSGWNVIIAIIMPLSRAFGYLVASTFSYRLLALVHFGIVSFLDPTCSTNCRSLHSIGKASSFTNVAAGVLYVHVSQMATEAHTHMFPF